MLFWFDLNPRQSSEGIQHPLKAFQTIVNYLTRDGTGKTNAAVVAESDARNEGQPLNIKGSLAELQGGGDVRRQLREGVKGTLGLDEGDSINRLETLAKQLTPMVVAPGHGVDAVPRTLKSS